MKKTLQKSWGKLKKGRKEVEKKLRKSWGKLREKKVEKKLR